MNSFYDRWRLVLGLFVCAMLVVSLEGAQQMPKRDATATTAPPGPSAVLARTSRVKTEATLNQLMRGVMYPASNVVFAAQGDLSQQPDVPHPAVSPNPLTNSYGGWQAVENAALALYETAGLIAGPRPSSNGRPAPVQRADWIKSIQDLRDAGLGFVQGSSEKRPGCDARSRRSGVGRLRVMS